MKGKGECLYVVCLFVCCFCLCVRFSFLYFGLFRCLCHGCFSALVCVCYVFVLFCVCLCSLASSCTINVSVFWSPRLCLCLLTRVCLCHQCVCLFRSVSVFVHSYLLYHQSLCPFFVSSPVSVRLCVCPPVRVCISTVASASRLDPQHSSEMKLKPLQHFTFSRQTLNLCMFVSSPGRRELETSPPRTNCEITRKLESVLFTC